MKGFAETGKFSYPRPSLGLLARGLGWRARTRLALEPPPADDGARVYPRDGSGRKPEDVSTSASLTLEVPVAARSAADEEAMLVARCLDGDGEAFRPLVERHQRVVFSVALRMLGSRADAEDVAQQAFVDAYGALERFRGEGRTNAFASWVIRIAINRCKDVLKSKKRTEAPLDGEIAGRQAMFAHEPRDPERALGEARAQHALGQALLRLPEKYREVLVLKDIEELPFEEIRTILGLPLTTVKMRAVRAREMLREALEATMKETP